MKEIDFEIQEKLIRNNFSDGRILNGTQQGILYIILHTEADSRGPSVDAILNWWNSVEAKASAHYLVQLDGQVVRAVLEKNAAWHAANSYVNIHSIGIEHEDDGNPNDPKRTDILYQRSAHLIADICQRYYIPCKLVEVDRDKIPVQSGILKHNQVSKQGTACPGGLDCERLIYEARNFLYGG